MGSESTWNIKELALGLNLNPGDEFGGLTVVRSLAKGGFSEIFEVTKPPFGKPRILKVVLPSDMFPDGYLSPTIARSIGGDSASKRASREALLIDSLDHPNIAKVEDLILNGPAESAGIVMRNLGSEESATTLEDVVQDFIRPPWRPQLALSDDKNKFMCNLRNLAK